MWASHRRSDWTRHTANGRVRVLSSPAAPRRRRCVGARDLADSRRWMSAIAVSPRPKPRCLAGSVRPAPAGPEFGEEDVGGTVAGERRGQREDRGEPAVADRGEPLVLANAVLPGKRSGA